LNQESQTGNNFLEFLRNDKTLKEIRRFVKNDAGKKMNTHRDEGGIKSSCN